MNRKIIFIVGAIIIVLVLGSSFLWMKSGFIDYRPENNQTEKAPQSTNKVNNWKTYANIKYDYQIKYPANWAVEVDGVVVWQDQVPNPELGNSIMFFGTKTEPYGQTARTLWNIRVFVSLSEKSQKTFSS